MDFKRAVEIQRASFDAEGGTFRATLFTDGEASDGHVLNIAGADLSEERIPMFADHWPSPTEQLGSMTNPRRRTRDGLRTVEYQAHLELGGEGPFAAVRQDLAHMIQAGHVSRLSGRWDAEQEDTVRRINLPSDHPAHVGAGAPARQRFGLWFKKWRPMEGSIVGLGADPAAVMRAADGARDDKVREFWRAFHVTQEADGMGDLEEALRMVGLRVAEAQEAGADEADLMRAFEFVRDAELSTIEVGGRQLIVLSDVAEAFEAQRQSESSLIELVGELSAKLDAQIEEVRGLREAAQAERELAEEESSEAAETASAAEGEEAEGRTQEAVAAPRVVTLDQLCQGADELAARVSRGIVERTRGRVSR